MTDANGNPIEFGFAETDLFVLMGGCDTAMMCCSAQRIPVGSIYDEQLRRWKQRTIDRWRRTLVKRHRASGLVDDAGNPSPFLAQTLAPLMTTGGTYVADGDSPVVEDWEEGSFVTERRNACVYVLGSLATHVKRGRGLRNDWVLRPLAPEEVAGAVLSLHDVGNWLRPSPPAEHYVVPDDPDGRWIRSAMREDGRYLCQVASYFGFDPSRLLAFGSWWQQEGLRRQNSLRRPETKPMLEFSTRDFSRCGYEMLGTFREPEPHGPLVARMARVFPETGFCFSIERAPRACDPDNWWDYEELHKAGQFVTGDFVEHPMQLVTLLLSVDANPNRMP